MTFCLYHVTSKTSNQCFFCKEKGTKTHILGLTSTVILGLNNHKKLYILFFELLRTCFLKKPSLTSFDFYMQCNIHICKKIQFKHDTLLHEPIPNIGGLPNPTESNWPAVRNTSSPCKNVNETSDFNAEFPVYDVLVSVEFRVCGRLVLTRFHLRRLRGRQLPTAVLRRKDRY